MLNSAGLVCCIVLLVAAASEPVCQSPSADDSFPVGNTGPTQCQLQWETAELVGHSVSDGCGIDRVDHHFISQQIFEDQYKFQQPVILKGLDNSKLQQLTQKQTLLDKFGGAVITLSTANTFSYSKVRAPLHRYLTETLRRHDPTRLGNETLYLFGPASELGNALAPLTAHYTPPPHAGPDLAFAFGIGGNGSGVPFHVHGEGWSEVMHGAKRWLLYPPHHRPPFDPQASSATWLHDVLPGLQGLDSDLLLDCIIEPGQALYFPDMWWHATVNIGETVFMSSFEGPQRRNADRRAPLGPALAGSSFARKRQHPF